MSVTSRPKLAGTSLHDVGVYGQQGEVSDASIDLEFKAGVFGVSSNDIGVVGCTTASYGVGVYGAGGGLGSVGVVGGSESGYGVIGNSEQSSGVVGQSAAGPSGTVGPIPGPSLATDAGVYGTASALPGVTGTSTASAGVLSFSNHMTTNADGHSPDAPLHGKPRALVRRLRRGKAQERSHGGKARSDFAKVIKRGDYRVFVTPGGDCRGLYVRRKSAESFEVRELTGGKSSVAFSYRIVGRRKDIKGHRRFAKIDLRVPLPAPRGTSRKTVRAQKLRAFAARIGKQMRQRRAKGVPKGRRSRVLLKGPRHPASVAPSTGGEEINEAAKPLLATADEVLELRRMSAFWGQRDIE